MKYTKVALLLLSFLIFSTGFFLPYRFAIHASPKTIRILPILMEFSDHPRMRTEEEMWEMFFSDEPGIPSLRNYFLEVTDQRYEFIPGSYGVGKWIRLPRTKQDYARESTLESLMEDIMKILQAQEVPLKEYDQNSDGYIDHFLLVQSGDPIRMVRTIFWLHKWTVGRKIGYDGVFIRDYTLSSEVFQADKLAPLQGICHEFCHDLGAWDLYDYDYDSQYAVGPWDIMADNRSNFGLSGFTRSYLGWLDPIIIKESGTYTLDALCSDGPNRLYRIDLPGTKEYFLLENRHHIGVDSWWKGTPDEGLIISHIDGAIPIQHRFNDGPPKYRNFAVWTEDAGNIRGKVDAAFNLEDSQIAFTPETNPNSRDYYNNSKPSIYITEVSNSGMQMSFRIDFRYEEPYLKVHPTSLIFGEVEKGKTKSMPLQLTNIGISTLRAEISASFDWIIPRPVMVFGNEVTVEVSIDTKHMSLGKNKGYLDIKSNGGQRIVPVEIEIIRLKGDFNGDGRVNHQDWTLFEKAYGSQKGDEHFVSLADFNQDEKIDIYDLRMMAMNYDR